MTCSFITCSLILSNDSCFRVFVCAPSGVEQRFCEAQIITKNMYFKLTGAHPKKINLHRFSRGDVMDYVFAELIVTLSFVAIHLTPYRSLSNTSDFLKFTVCVRAITLQLLQ